MRHCIALQSASTSRRVTDKHIATSGESAEGVLTGAVILASKASKEETMWKEFRTFIMKGNVLDMAIGIIIGAAFGKIVTSFVNDVLMPPIGLLLGGIDFSNLFATLKGPATATLADAQAAGAVTINYGLFINTVIDFLIVAFVIFLVVRQVNKMRAAPAPEPAAPTTKDCPFCLSSIPIKASRCPHCTSELKE